MLDNDDCIAYTHGQSGDGRSVLEPDPRFVRPPDAWEVVQAKAKNISDLNMGIFLCQSLMDEFHAVPEEVPLPPSLLPFFPPAF